MRIIQKYVTETNDYDFVYQQEYSRISKMENVIGNAQETLNSITDEMRKVATLDMTKAQIDLLSCTDVVEFLTRKGETLALCYFKRLYSLGIEKYVQLVRESKYPRSDNIKKLADFVLRAFPVDWMTLMEDNEVNEDIILTDNFPCLGGKVRRITKVTVQIIKKALRGQHGDASFPYNTKLGIINHPGLNPFVANKRSNHSIALRFFKFRLLHGDMYTKERMCRFKMTQNNRCNYCGIIEDTKHMLWECPRLDNIWCRLGLVFKNYDPGGEITFETLFIGYNPTNTVLESIITRVTRSIVTRERDEVVQVQKIRHEVLEHCSINIYALKKARRETIKWECIKTLMEEQL